MSTKEYVKKFNLDKGWNAKVQKEFTASFNEDMLVLINDINPNTFAKFDQVIKMMHDKFNGISNKVPYGLPDYVWSHFYKSFIVPARAKCCPEENEKHNAEYRAEGERRKELAKKRKEEEEFWKNKKKSQSNFLKLVSIDEEKVVYRIKEGTFQTTREDFDKDFIVKDGKILPNDDYRARLDKINDLISEAAANFIMSTAKNNDPGKKLTWMMMFGSRIEEIQKLDQRLNGFEVISLIRQRINLVVGPGWWDKIRNE